MTSAIQMLLSGPPVDKTGEPYRTYQAGLLLSARIKAALWILRHHQGLVIRRKMQSARKDLARRSDARVVPFGLQCSRIEPTIPQETLDALRDRHPAIKNQAYALVRAAIDDLSEIDRATQDEVCVMILSETL